MSRISFFIDGFNVYHSLIAGKPNPSNSKRKIKPYRQYLWLSYYKFARRFIKSGDTISDVYYFTAYAKWLPDRYLKHQIFVKAQKNEGVKVVFGKFKNKEKFCTCCHRYFWGHEEKRSDVNIGIHLLKDAVLKKYDTAYLVTADTDLIPAIRTVREMYPEKTIGVIFPLDRSQSKELKRACNIYRVSKKSDYSKSQLDDPYTLPDGAILNKPESWK